jgi:hypothetical protein
MVEVAGLEGSAIDIMGIGASLQPSTHGGCAI